MLKKEGKKIKTLLDFEEVADDFTEALLELDVDDAGEDPKKRGMITWTEFSPEQLDDFAEMVWDTAEEICHTLIGKNIRYRGAYWWARKACKEKYGDSSIPYFVHSFEKTLRSGCPGDTEDAQLDKVGYEFLEYVCQKLEEKWESGNSEADEPEPAFDNCFDEEQQSCSESRNASVLFDKFKHDVRALYGEDPEEPDEEHRRRSESQQFDNCLDALPTIDPDMPLDEPEPVPVSVPVNTCIQCGKPLTGKQRRFCSKKCSNDWSKTIRLDRICVICGKPFTTTAVIDAKTCSIQCANELRAATILKNAADRRWKESQEKKANNWLESE